MSEKPLTAFCLHCGRLWKKPLTARDHACQGCGTPWGWREPMDRDTLLFRLRAAGSLINGDVDFAMRRAIGALIGYTDDPEISRAFLAIMCGKSPEAKKVSTTKAEGS